MMDEILEHFILYGVSDDWAPLDEFVSNVNRITPTNRSRERVLEIIRELAEKGYTQLGAFPGGGEGWKPWDVPVDEAMRRIAHGFNGEAGYLDLPDDRIGRSEVFRAALTPNGEARLAELGNPYDIYGDPFYDTGARADGYKPWRPEGTGR